VVGSSGFDFSVLPPVVGVYLARYNPNSTPDTTFGTNGVSGISTSGGNSTAAAAVLQPDGKIVVVGSVVARFLGDTPAADANQQFVSTVYLDLLERPADSGGLASWTGLLDSGAETRQQVALGIESSQEYHDLVVNELYGEYLQRAADPTGLAAWSAFLAGGGTEDQLRAVLLGSAEYFTDSGSTASGFVASVYIDVLERPVDSGGAEGWSQALADGATRTAVAAAIIRSFEGNNVEVTDLYFWLLHRAPDTGGLQAFSQELAQGGAVDAIVATMIGSSEYASTRV
jgi:hypothetical protein